MSIFKATFPKGVQEQLKARQDKMIARDASAIRYLNSRAAWIRMTSAVQVDEDGGDLAKKNVLLGGALYNNAPRAGVGTTGTEAYSTKTPSGVDHRLGMRPMPGITGIEIKNKGAYGSLREITVSFKCWDIKQLEDLELLYMRPGYTVLVEWGWLPYLKNDGSLGNIVPLTDDVRDSKVGGKTKEEIWKTIFTKASTDGNYDAIYGFIKNYSWSARPDGGYDCTTSLITMGEILESLKINYGASDTSIATPETKGIFGLLEGSYFEKNSSVSKSYSQNKLAGMLNEIWEIVKPKISASPVGKADVELNGVSYNFLRYDLTVAGRDAAAIKDSFVEEDQQIYITLKGFVDLLNKQILLQDTQAKKPMVEVSVTEGAHNGGKEGDPLLCLGNKFQLSTDPTICQIKNMAWTDLKNVELEALAEDKGTDTETLKSLMNTIKEDYFLNGDFEDKQLGVIGNIYVNLGFLYSLVVNDELASQDKKEKKDINLYDYLKNILSGINNSIGNVATLDIFIDPVDSVARIIDLNYVDQQSRAKVYENAFTLEMHNLRSTVRSYKLESQIFPDQSTTISIGAQAKGGALAADTNTLIDFNKGLIDRVVPAKDAPPLNQEGNEKDDLKSKLEALKTSLGVILSYINTTDPSWYEHAGDFDVANSSKYANALKDIINFYKSFVKDDNKNRSIIPTKLSIEMDGIGGIIIGNLFKIPLELLPRGYKGEKGIGSKIAYVVTEIGASVTSTNDWVTKLGAQFIILDEPGGGNLSVWTSATAKVIKAITKQNEVSEEAVDKTKEIMNKAAESASSQKTRPKQDKNCKEIYYVVNQSVAPGVNIPDKTSWTNIKKSYPIRPAEVPVISIGTPLDSGNDFHYKMKSTKVSKRTSPANYIVLHYTVSEKDDPTYHYKNTWESRDASADFTIGRNGRIAGFKSYKTHKAWQYGTATWPGGANFNNESIGFEIETTGWAYYCKTNNKFYTNYNTELSINEVALTPTYRGHNIWHYHTDVQISAIANLIIALYNDGAISDKTTFLSNCTGNNRYGILFPDNGLTTKPKPGIITHGTGRQPSGKVDTFPQKNLLDMLDDLPTLIKSNPKTYINWTK